MADRDGKGGQDVAEDFFDIFADSVKEAEEELQELIGNISELPELRPLHYHFTHNTLPEYLANPESLAVFLKIMARGGEEKLIQDLYDKTLKDYPKSMRCFGTSEIICSRHRIKSSWQDITDFPLLVFTMPQPKAHTESFLACVGLLPRQEFYHNQEWRYFVVDGQKRPGTAPPTSILYEYALDGPPSHNKGGFLLMGSCCPEIDGLLRELEYKWDDRFYTL